MTSSLNVPTGLRQKNNSIFIISTILPVTAGTGGKSSSLKELENKEGMITIKKSQYVTQVYINGMDMGTSMACYTPIEFPVNKAIKFGAENEILIKVGERIWLAG